MSQSPDAVPPLPSSGVLPYATPGNRGPVVDVLPSVDAAGNVISDSPCRKCGHNLRGLSINGRCPECASPVGLSIHGDLLRFSDPKWVRTLQRGVRFIILSIAIIVFGVVASILIAFVSPTLVPWLAVIFVAAAVLGLLGS